MIDSKYRTPHEDEDELVCTCANVSFSHALGEPPDDAMQKRPIFQSSYSYSPTQSQKYSDKDKYYRRTLSLGTDTSKGAREYGKLCISSPEKNTYKGLSSSSSSFADSGHDSPKIHFSSAREMTDFERDNLLFLKELEAKRKEQQRFIEKQVSELPYQKLKEVQDIIKTSKWDSLSKGKSPSPKTFRKREFPATAFFPSKSSASEILRSVSLEDPEEDEEEDNYPSFQEASSDSTSYQIRSSCPTFSVVPSSKARINAPLSMSMSVEKPAETYTASSSTLVSLFGQRSLSAPCPGEELEVLPQSLPRTDSAKEKMKKMDELFCKKVDAALASLQKYIDKDTTQRETKPVKSDPPKSEPEETTDDPASTPSEPPKSQPMAFTVDLTDSNGSDSSGSVQSAKKLDISGAISQFAPPSKHRRNASLSKVEENKVLEFFDEKTKPKKRRSTISRLDKVDDQQKPCEKPPIGRPRSGTIGAPVHRRGGYHSEGYFSSDQEDEIVRKTELKSPRTSRNKDPSLSPGLTRSSSEPHKSSSIRARSESPSNSYTVPLTQSANFLIERMITSTPETKRKNSGKPEGRTCCKERKPSVSELTGRTSRDKSTSPKSTSPTVDKTEMLKAEIFTSDDKQDEDDASDTGTYTIDKDSPSPEAESARQNIEHVFGVITESEAELTSSTAVPHSTTDAYHDDETSWLSSSEVPKTKVHPILSRNSPNWIQQWADHVAEQTKPALSPVQRNPSNHTPISNDGRPRRKLPTPPTRLPSSPARTINKSDLYETPVSKAKIRGSYENHESGVDSDLDARVSYNEELFANSLRNKLRLTGLEKNKTRTDLADSQTDQPADDTPYDDQSDSSSEISEPFKDVPRTDNNPPLKFNRAFSLRRARLGCDDGPKTPDNKKAGRPTSAGHGPTRKVPLGVTRPYQSMDSSAVSSPRGYGYGRGTKTSPVDKPHYDNFLRNDGGRFSLRLAKSGSTSAIPRSPTKTPVKKEPGTTGSKRAPRSNSTLSSKEVDFQNWKRRKNYDPMKAAAEGRKKQVSRKGVKDGSAQETTDDQGSPSPPNSLLRSASFHGTGADTLAQRWEKKRNPRSHNNTDIAYSTEEEFPAPRKVASPQRPSPNSPNSLASPARHNYSVNGRVLRASVEDSDHCESPPHFQATRKVSLDESGSEGKRSPLNSQTGSARGTRGKNKMEALDNLVISTIHSLSVKVRTTSESLLLKLKSQYDEEGDRAALLQEVLSHLSESDQSGSTQARSTSRELAGILRNLKKIEQSLQVIDRVMVDGEDYEDEDLTDVGNDWAANGY